jgi:hypothetical protein
MDCCGTVTVAEQLAALNTSLVGIQAAVDDIVTPPPIDLVALQNAVAEQVLEEIRDDLPGGSLEQLIAVTQPANGIAVQDGNLYVTTFEFSTGVGSREFAVGQIRSLSLAGDAETEIDRPQVIVFGTDSVRVTFWGDAPIANGSFQVWIYRASGEDLIATITPNGGVQTTDAASGLLKTTFRFATGVGSRNFAVGQIRQVAAGVDEIEILRPEVVVTGVDEVQLTFWGATIPDGSFQVWIYKANYQLIN